MSESREPWRLGHRPALDGLRGLAILLVLICHTGVPLLYASGPAGVTVFFTLSGFLITSLLVEEHAKAGRIDLRRFYLRRVRRLAPAFLASTLAIAAMGTLAGAAWIFQPSDLAPVLAYVGNWRLANGGSLGALGGTWSLAVEEQFYLAWPLVVLIVLRRWPRLLGVIAGLIVVASLALRVGFWLSGAPPVEVYYRSDTTASALAAGALLAIVAHSRPLPARRRLGAVGVALLLIAALAQSAVEYVVPVMATAAGVLVLMQAATQPARWMSGRVMVWLGQRSYGLYLWHIAPAWILRDQGLSWPLVTVLVMPSALLAAELSYRFIERPFRSDHVSQLDHGEPVHTSGCESSRGARVLVAPELDVVSGG